MPAFAGLDLTAAGHGCFSEPPVARRIKSFSKSEGDVSRYRSCTEEASLGLKK